MKHLLRPDNPCGFAVAAALCAAAAISPHQAAAQATQITQVLQEPSPLLMGSTSQGYLGVLVGDIDSEAAAKLKLKDVRGAVITLIDHDAPAGQVGLKVNDVVLELNGQQIEGAEQLRRMLHEIPPGRKVTILISRDGATQTLATQMGDHKKIVEGFWTKIGNGGDIFPAAGPGNNLLGGGDTPSSGSGLRFSIFGSSLKVGAMVEPLTTQMAEYFGVPRGLMVKQVARKTEADAAGLKAFDVILKVGPDNISTIADWERSLHANQGKPVQLTILRDKKQQTLMLQVDSKHNKGELEMEELFPSDGDTVVAELDPEAARIFEVQDSADALALAHNAGYLENQLRVDPQMAEQMRRQAQAIEDQLRSGDLGRFELDAKATEQMSREAEAMRDGMKGFNPDAFKLDEKQMDELKLQMDQWKKNFNPDEFKVDPRQLEEMNQQFEEWKKSFNPDTFKFDEKQIQRFREQMDEWNKEMKPEMFQLAPQFD